MRNRAIDKRERGREGEGGRGGGGTVEGSVGWYAVAAGDLAEVGRDHLAGAHHTNIRHPQQKRVHSQ